MKKLLLFLLVIITLYSCEGDSNIQPSIPPLEQAISKINTLVKNNPGYDAALLEREISMILRSYKLNVIKDERVIDLLTIVRTNVIAENVKTPEQPKLGCTGKISSYETVDGSPNGDWSGEWVAVYHFANGETYYRWYDANNKVLKEGCFHGAQDLE